MIISRTPFRISFFGGGTDYPAWWREHGGAVLATTIDKYCHITCRYLPPFFDHKHRIVYSKVETVKHVHEIQHPVVRTLMEHMSVGRHGVEIHHDGDLPHRSGIGSSSSFTVGLINTFKAIRGEFISKEELAKQAIHVEQNVLGEAVGCQDQISAAYGGMNRIEFNPDGTFLVSPIIISPERKAALGRNLMLFFTGFSRTAQEVAKTKIANMGNRTVELQMLRALVEEGCAVLRSPGRDLEDFGKLLHEGWRLKRSLSDRVSTAGVDRIYEAGMEAGASGGKLLGAGGGGFILFYVKPELQQRVREKLKGLIEVSFRFETNGSAIVLYNPEQAHGEEAERMGELTDDPSRKIVVA